MASLKFYANKISKNVEIRIGVNHRSKTRYINTKIRVAAHQWDENASIVVKHPQASQYNILLASRISNLNEKLLRLSISGVNFNALSCSELRDLLLDKPLKSQLLLPAIVNYANEAKTEGTSRVYMDTYKLLYRYIGEEAGELGFEEVTPKWLYAFDRWMSRTMSTNTRSIHMRNLRAVFNRAIDEDAISCYPFRKFKIKHEQTRKRSLTIDQLRKLMTMELSPARAYYRDMFMLTFYLIGINTADLLPLTEISASGRIEYRRAKTGRMYSIKVEPEALEIINRYQGEEHLLIAGDNYSKGTDFTRLIARRLKGIKGYEFISIYWARHTWATIAAELDIPKETIAAALGHSDNSVTAIYIKFNPKKIDIANRKVIDYLKGKEL